MKRTALEVYWSMLGHRGELYLTRSPTTAPLWGQADMRMTVESYSMISRAAVIGGTRVRPSVLRGVSRLPDGGRGPPVTAG